MSIKTFYKVEKSSEKSLKISIVSIFFALIAIGLVSFFIISGSVNSFNFLIKHIIPNNKETSTFVMNELAQKVTIDYFLFDPKQINSSDELQRVFVICIINASALAGFLLFFVLYLLHSFLVMIRSFITYHNAMKLEKEWKIENKRNKLMKIVCIMSITLFALTIINEIIKIALVLHFRRGFKFFVKKIDEKIKQMNLEE